MLRIIPLETAGALSFPDCQIIDFRYDGQAIRFITDGIFIDGEGFLNAHTTVECFGASPAHSRQSIDNEWGVDDPGVGGLDSVHEWSVEQDVVKLAGFCALSGMWREYGLAVDSISIEPSVAP